MIFPCPCAPYIPTLCTISGRAQVQNNLSLLLGYQLLILPMGHAAGGGTFFHSLRFQSKSFLEALDSVLKHFKKRKFIR